MNDEQKIWIILYFLFAIITIICLFELASFRQAMVRPLVQQKGLEKKRSSIWDFIGAFREYRFLQRHPTHPADTLIALGLIRRLRFAVTSLFLTSLAAGTLIYRYPPKERHADPPSIEQP